MIKKIKKVYTNLSIIKKIIIAPILAMACSLILLILSYFQIDSIQKNSKKLELVLIPLLEKSFQNRTNFKNINEIFSFAVSTDELEYLQNSKIYIDSIKNNLRWIEKNYPLASEKANKSREIFQKYLEVANQMAINMKQDESGLLNQERLIDNVFKYSNKVKNNFNSQYNEAKQLISIENSKVDKKITFLLNNGIFNIIIFYLFLFVISFLSYHSIKQGFSKLLRDVNFENLKEKDLYKFADNEFGILSKRFYGVIEAYKKLENEKNEMEKIAKKDQLTNLYNRYYFEEILEEFHSIFLKSDLVYGVLLLDIDYFKNINDTYGHLQGDEVLKSLANLLNSQLRDEDKIARWGGEEFIILLSNIDKEQLFMIAEKFRKNIENLELHTVGNITASFGGSCIKKNLTSKELIKISDDALYEAKNSGRNKVVIY